MVNERKEPAAAELLWRAEDGDPQALAAIEGFGRDIVKLGESFRTGFSAFRQPTIDPAALDELGEGLAAEKRAAVEREEAMIGELAAMRQAVERAEGRAEAAEGRESEALDLARRNYRVAVTAVVVAIVIAVLSIAATVLVPVLA